MIESWMFDGKELGLSYQFRVEITKDCDVTPEEFDCYDAADVAAWKRDDWEFVIVTVTPVIDGVVFEAALQSLGGVEYGRLDGKWLDQRELEGYPIPDLAKEAAHEADEIQARMAESLTASV